jgi:hypothetical protein
MNISELYCAPNIKTSDMAFTCFEYTELIEIATAFNKWVKKTKKKQPVIDLNSNMSKFDLHQSINNSLKKLCKTEYCWTKLDFIEKIPDQDLKLKLKYFTFKPETTKKSTSWLSTNHIDEIMHQYEKKYDRFKFIGTVPADVLRMNILEKYDERNFDYIGIIFNKDTHGKPGSHWVSCFIKCPEYGVKTIEYFDSLGGKPNKFIQEFLDLYTHRGFTLTINKVVHQQESNLCGVYACFFIIQRLKGLTFNEINANIITDEFMAVCKDEYFRPR